MRTKIIKEIGEGMKKKNINKLYSVVFLGMLSAGNILFVHSGVWNSKAGTVLDIAAWDAPVYQVESASQLKDGSYLIASKATGFQSEIQVAVTFDAVGEVILNAEVISQGETEGLGTKIKDESFLGQFRGTPAPVTLKGKDLTVVSPATGAVWGTDGAETEAVGAAVADNRSDPKLWNPSDQSPEAMAVRDMYRAGLLTSATEKRPLQTALADKSAEEQAAYRLEEAGLTVAAAAEEVTAAESVLGDISELDAVSGATVSSTAVVHGINNAYFFMQEKVLN